MKKILSIIFMLFLFGCNDSKGPYSVEVIDNSNNKVVITSVKSFTVKSADGKVIFSGSTGEVIIPKDTVVISQIKGRKILVGVNTNHYQPKLQQKKFQGTRLYFPIGWGFTDRGFYGQPMKQGQKQYLGLDDYLSDMKSSQVDVLLTLMQSPDWLNGYNSGGLNTNDYPPIRPGLSRELPNSYGEVGKIYKAFAIRYGSKTHPVGSYKVDPAGPRWNGDLPQVYQSGLKLIEFMEAGNELDRWWDVGTLKYMNPAEHVAFLKTVYDSIKSADPTIKVVMAGLTNYDLKYLKQMNDVCKRLGIKFPSDVINVHHYSSSGNLAGIHPPNWPINSAICPELDKDMPTLKLIVDFANSLGLETWVTEYGYDTTSGSQLATATNSEQNQADWIVRSALEQIRLGASRSYVFTIADEPNPIASLFQSSGLLKGEPFGYAEKKSFVQYVNLTNELRGFNYLADESTPTIRILKFVNGNQFKYAYWSPTMNGTKTSSIINGKNVLVTETVQFLN